MRTYLQEMLKRKDLLIYLVKSGLKAENRNSYLGYFWWLLDPLLNVAVYYFVVVVVLDRGGPDYPVYLVIGLVVWRWTSTTVNQSAKAITKYASIINQVYLPKSLFPIAVTATQVFNFSFGLVVIGIFMAIFGVIPGWQVIFLPIIILVQLLLLFSLAFCISYFCVFIRDIDNILSHIIRIFFYASPIIWYAEERNLPENLEWVITYNPIAVLLGSYRNVLMYGELPNFMGLAIIALFALLLIGFMLYYFSKNEHKIIKAL